MSVTTALKSMMSRKLVLGTSLGVALVFMVAGVIFWGGFNTAMEMTNTMDFCISCHEMEENVYEEYKTTVHYSNRSGVQAQCSDCHVPRPWVHKVIRKIQASREVLGKITGVIDTPEKFDSERMRLATNVWNAMKNTDSRECRNCHDFTTMNPENQKPRARKQHMNAMEAGNTCIDCHKGIAHKQVHQNVDEEVMDKLVQPDPALAIPLPPQWVAFLEKEKEEERIAKEKAAAAAEAAKIAREKAKAEAAAKAKEMAAAGVAAAPTAAGSGIDWSAVPSREVTVFYPGQASMEWVRRGKDHGGARPYKAGDRCVDCHDKEVADMGQKIVTGEKDGVEPTVIPDKRGSIPVNVQAGFDADNLYLRFEWADSAHTPAPFVDGGKMDADNQMKLAFMLATDEVAHASQAGCWGTCHADLNGMPFAPEGKDITKYIEESRTKLELKGRGGKALGGWDKLKDAGDIDAEFKAGHFMDIVRYKSGSKVTETGSILADRKMAEDKSVEFVAKKEGDNWVVEVVRKLNTGKEGDVVLEAGKVYNFGFAIHDDYTNGRYHHVSLGYKLGFENGDVEINAAPVERAAVTAAPAAAPAAASGGGNGVDWAGVVGRDITVFYPGQASMEWVRRGKDHGGARPYKAGDRCVDCHDKEVADMGQKIVTGEKEGVEPTIIPDKRGSIPVNVKASYDADTLFLRFEWADSAHTPAPFVDGGKMDVDNQMKLAFMLATDQVAHASQAGCWGTCHADLNGMPFAPEGKDITKYIEESRTKLELKGRGGKALGGWDKLKEAGDIDAEFKAGHFMDIVRYKSGSKVSETGSILADRKLAEDKSVEFVAQKEGDNWVVEVARKLNTGKEGDVVLEPGSVYNFGFAIHDDYTNGRYHHVSLGYKLGFDNVDVEVNATAK